MIADPIGYTGHVNSKEIVCRISWFLMPKTNKHGSPKMRRITTTFVQYKLPADPPTGRPTTRPVCRTCRNAACCDTTKSAVLERRLLSRLRLGRHLHHHAKPWEEEGSTLENWQEIGRKPVADFMGKPMLSGKDVSLNKSIGRWKPKVAPFPVGFP